MPKVRRLLLAIISALMLFNVMQLNLDFDKSWSDERQGRAVTINHGSTKTEFSRRTPNSSFISVSHENAHRLVRGPANEVPQSHIKGNDASFEKKVPRKTRIITFHTIETSLGNIDTVGTSAFTINGTRCWSTQSSSASSSSSSSSSHHHHHAHHRVRFWKWPQALAYAQQVGFPGFMSALSRAGARQKWQLFALLLVWNEGGAWIHPSVRCLDQGKELSSFLSEVGTNSGWQHRNSNRSSTARETEQKVTATSIRKGKERSRSSAAAAKEEKEADFAEEFVTGREMADGTKKEKEMQKTTKLRAGLGMGNVVLVTTPVEKNAREEGLTGSQAFEGSKQILTSIFLYSSTPQHSIFESALRSLCSLFSSESLLASAKVSPASSPPWSNIIDLTIYNRALTFARMYRAQPKSELRRFDRSLERNSGGEWLMMNDEMNEDDQDRHIASHHNKPKAATKIQQTSLLSFTQSFSEYYYLQAPPGQGLMLQFLASTPDVRCPTSLADRRRGTYQSRLRDLTRMAEPAATASPSQCFAWAYANPFRTSRTLLFGVVGDTLDKPSKAENDSERGEKEVAEELLDVSQDTGISRHDDVTECGGRREVEKQLYADDNDSALSGRANKKQIPRIIHQIDFKPSTKRAKMPMYSLMEKWKVMNPEYDYVLWQEESIEKFLSELEDSSTTLQTYQRLDFVQKSDFLRYLLLFHIGGIYADHDVEPLVPLSRWPLLLQSTTPPHHNDTATTTTTTNTSTRNDRDNNKDNRASIAPNHDDDCSTSYNGSNRDGSSTRSSSSHSGCGDCREKNKPGPDVSLIAGVEAFGTRLQQEGLIWARNPQFCQWLLVASPGNPVLWAAISRIKQQVASEVTQAAEHVNDYNSLLHRKTPSDTGGCANLGHKSCAKTIELTGPGLFTDVLVGYLRMFGISAEEATSGIVVSSVAILPVDAFACGQEHSGADRLCETSSALVRHHFAGNWKTADEQAYSLGNDQAMHSSTSSDFDLGASFPSRYLSGG
eukprot:CAMPEP_0184503854 /NCGR_PEP_ID=MMETSP0113_2-20130426/52136_1 /TAXON_ID=91329 /ORGANISM="Norrisiella sphaerica, Strain BC52" /LENGTH=1004 /DNA_ID=CAMNT_0026893423 /DNA_START=173 /DNA_END=3187 /DNA_ORIENTATION=-